MRLDKNDLQTLAEIGKSTTQYEEELAMIANGFPYLDIKAAATVGNGITRLTPDAEQEAEDLWREYISSEGTVIKMVPASGAATRMFKDLHAFVNGDSEIPDTPYMKKFFDNIEKFAFFRRLNLSCVTLYQMNVEELKHAGRYKDIVKIVLMPYGLNYSRMPKAMIMFHKVLGSTATALEEHLAEGSKYAVDKDGNVNIHFTVSPEHLPLMHMKVKEIQDFMGKIFGVKYHITFSVQKPSTDTIATNPDGTPFRVNGKLMFRPGGHGALIENLNDLDSNVVFIKNIDNVTTHAKVASTQHYKRVLGGIAVGIREKIDKYIKALENETATADTLDEIFEFLEKELYITNPRVADMSHKDKVRYLLTKLNRPLRVCGMVKNEGEPGGGPFLVANAADGSITPQIVEMPQIDTSNPEMRQIVSNSTHFNPVDLVCVLHDGKGRKYHLPDYVDKTTGFISNKSYNGKELKALELPGLWCGAMSDWNTVFVEVPIETFNPVKVVNDLLKDAHQPT